MQPASQVPALHEPEQHGVAAAQGAPEGTQAAAAGPHAGGLPLQLMLAHSNPA
jgi:hypothetical protein